MSVPDTTAHHLGSSGVHASMGKGWVGSTKETITILDRYIAFTIQTNQNTNYRYSENPNYDLTLRLSNILVAAPMLSI